MICRNRILIRQVSTTERRKIKENPVFHNSQQPRAEPNIDFTALGLKYKIDNNDRLSKETFWTRPEKLPDLPFAVDRTLVNNTLPVYTDIKGGNTKVITIVKNCRGDIETMKRELEIVVGHDVEMKPGKLIVTGNYSFRVKIWLAKLGF
jgi:hypothetical protein